jgi:hypothetical protein
MQCSSCGRGRLDTWTGGAHALTRHPHPRPRRRSALANSITPGPGAYGGDVTRSGANGHGAIGPASAFVSGVPRLATQAELKARKDLPG